MWFGNDWLISNGWINLGIKRMTLTMDHVDLEDCDLSISNRMHTDWIHFWPIHHRRTSSFRRTCWLAAPLGVPSRRVHLANCRPVQWVHLLKMGKQNWLEILLRKSMFCLKEISGNISSWRKCSRRDRNYLETERKKRRKIVKKTPALAKGKIKFFIRSFANLSFTSAATDPARAFLLSRA